MRVREQNRSAAVSRARLVSCLRSGNACLWHKTLTCNLSDYKRHEELYIATLSLINVPNHLILSIYQGNIKKNLTEFKSCCFFRQFLDRVFLGFFKSKMYNTCRKTLPCVSWCILNNYPLRSIIWSHIFRNIFHLFNSTFNSKLPLLINPIWIFIFQLNMSLEFWYMHKYAPVYGKQQLPMFKK